MTLREKLNIREPLSLAGALKLFNRKERNWVFRDAVGSAAEQVSESFRKRVEDTLAKKDEGFVLPAASYWATDYHLNWLVAVLHLVRDGFDSLEKPQKNDLKFIKGNQEDIDLVIASDDTLVLIEAKGDGAWTSKQMKSKMTRLKALSPGLIADDGTVGHIKVRFLLCSPRESPTKLDTKDWPKWAKTMDGLALHFRLHTPAPCFAKTERCDADRKASAEGGHWHVVATSELSAE